MLLQGKYRHVTSKINSKPIYLLKKISISVITLNNCLLILSVLLKFRRITVSSLLKTGQSRLSALESAIATHPQYGRNLR